MQIIDLIRNFEGVLVSCVLIMKLMLIELIEGVEDGFTGFLG